MKSFALISLTMERFPILHNQENNSMLLTIFQETPDQMAYICSQFLSEEEWLIGSKIKWNTTEDTSF